MTNHLALIALLLVELAKFEADPSVISNRLDELGRKQKKCGGGGFKGRT